MAKTRQKGVKTRQISILDLLDQKLSIYYQHNATYPKLILMNKETKDKVFEALDLEPTLDNSWKDNYNNYRGIEIKIKKNIFLELEGD